MIDRHDHSPWDFWTTATPAAQDAQRQHQQVLTRAHPEWRFGADCFVSELAAVDADTLTLGDRSYVAAGAYLTGTVQIGADCSINPYTVVRGRVVFGDGVRMGAHSSVLGFNHSMAPGIPVHRQPLRSDGVHIGDDVWIGSHVVVLDGVTVGSHAVLAAGAVVTKDVAPGAIVGGNPARLLRWRVPPAAPDVSPLATRLAAFADAARADADALLRRAHDADTGRYRDRPGAPITVRAQGDAIEIADLLLGSPPPGTDRDDLVALLQGAQDAATGAVAEWDAAGPLEWSDAAAAYHVLSTGYALDLLGAAFRHPLTLITAATPASIVERLESLPWETDAWHAGHHVDALGTALLWTKRRGDPVPAGVEEALFGWLVTRADVRSGMWGLATPDRGLLPLVNGFYRASRGTFAQFGVPVLHGDAVIDTVLRHARDERWLDPARRDACTVLDIAHPLWLTRGTGYRTAEIRSLAEDLLDHALAHWHPGAGMAFRLEADDPGLQGTEMWLAIIWYLADLVGLSDSLGYRPRGVHRPEPAPLPERTT